MHKYLPELKADNADIRVGLIGAGIQKSRSPFMHMQEAKAQALSLNYRLFDLEQLRCDQSALPYLLEEIQAAGYAGVNITHPCKQQVIEYLDTLSAEAGDLGAVNTVIFRDGKRAGHNTDWSGFYNSFSGGLPGAAIDNILQLGAGGAGSAVAYALARMGAGILSIFDTDADRAAGLADRLRDRFNDIDIRTLHNLDTVTADIDGLVNTTPVGMKNHPGLPLPASMLTPRFWVAEVIYFPLETELLSRARESACRILDGSGMAIHQAAEAFRLFTGKPADPDRLALLFAEQSDA